jgi:hypothetical protein
MKNEVKKKMTMQEHEVAVPKSLHDNFCKRNIQSSDAQSFLARIFFLTMIMNVEDALRSESTSMTLASVTVRCAAMPRRQAFSLSHIYNDDCEIFAGA